MVLLVFRVLFKTLFAISRFHNPGLLMPRRPLIGLTKLIANPPNRLFNKFFTIALQLENSSDSVLPASPPMMPTTHWQVSTLSPADGSPLHISKRSVLPACFAPWPEPVYHNINQLDQHRHNLSQRILMTRKTLYLLWLCPTYRHLGFGLIDSTSLRLSILLRAIG